MSKPESFSLCPDNVKGTGHHSGVGGGALHQNMPWDAACRGSMQKQPYNLFPVVFLLLILPVILTPPQVTGSCDEIVSTRNLLILADYPDDMVPVPVIHPEEANKTESQAVPAPESGPVMSVPIPAGLKTPAISQVSLLADPAPTPTPSMAKGWVQVNLGTSIDSPGQMVEDRQRYMASGLFNVHVYHQFAG